ncbi:MAG TPA: type IV pilus twitching motility protein PilT [Pyrinomonadaceae bacterium]|nr:type IV pilus twitching motility protein PilT [Pyrinomonadaceae bacterium]
MEQLDRYLECLINNSGYELRLEPNAHPYVVSAGGNTEVDQVPLQGSQISMMIFPLIPPDVKQELPNQPSVNFVHPSNFGEFKFNVVKSAAGFNVTISPVISNGCAPSEIVAGVESIPVLEPVAEEPAFEPITDGNPETIFPPIELKPIVDEAVATSDTDSQIDLEDRADDNAAQDVQQFGQIFSSPEDQFSGSTHDSFGEIAFEDLVPAPAYVPSTPEETSPAAVVKSDEVITNTVTDRRNGERRATNTQMKGRMEALFHAMSDAGASDLHLSVGMPPMIRKDGRMQRLTCAEDVLDEETMKDLLHSIMPERNKEEFSTRRDSDFAYEIQGLARFRSNIFMDRKGMGAVFRIIPSKMTTAEQLGLSKAIMGLCDLTKGLVVVTGPTGSGKSTTLCAMVNSINATREDHIITIEDPVEFVHENIKCLVNQREVHNHTMSFKDALRAALREDPDIILVGEMRDLETIAIAIETAETGHLVFGTLHTTTAVSTVDRIIDQFPADRQQQVRVMLSESLKGVVAQTLLPKKGGGRVAALEVLIVTPAISNLIREGKTFQIASAMQTGRGHGMVMLNDALYDLVQKGIVEPRDAYLKAVEKTGFEAMLTKGGYKV